MNIPKKVGEKCIYENPWRRIVEKDFIEKDGKTYTYLTISCRGRKSATMILPITQNNEIVLLKEFRVGIEDFVYNFPVGVHELDCTAEENCRKELKEETGFSPGSLELLGETILENYTDGTVKYYLATNCEPGKKEPEIGENMETLIVSKKHFKEMILDGTINCPLTIACFNLAFMKELV